MRWVWWVGVLACGWVGAAAGDDADRRAAALVARMTQDEKLAMLHGQFAVNVKPMGWAKPARAVGSAGFVPGLARLGIPDLQETDAGLGITNPFDVRPGDTAVALPSGLAVAASFNPEVAYRVGAVLGREAAARGLNVVLGGGLNLTREARGGRDFEYAGEDPWLAGVMVGAAVRGTQDQHVISTVKHFAANDQESLRQSLSVKMDAGALRESDLLAFEIAIEQGHPGAVMCSYNKVDDVYACENPFLLNRVLKSDWGFDGWVMSDWGALHSVGALGAGLDQESGEQLDSTVFFGAPLRAAVAAGQVAQARVDDAVRRIVGSEIRVGLLEKRAVPPADFAGDIGVARTAASEGIVLLRNTGAVLPLARSLRSVCVIGGNADAGVQAGGGSSQVTPVDGYARSFDLGVNGSDWLFRTSVFDPASPLSRIAAKLAGGHVMFTDGRYLEQAAHYAAACDVAIVFAHAWRAEASDAPDLALPDGQDALIERVARANRKTIVVLESGGPVLMPWRDHVAGIIEAWYPGQGGANAIADVLFGDVNPSGHLPMTFPASVADLPNPLLPGLYSPPGAALTVVYPEGANAGYRWFAARGIKPLYPFGFGLSYTSFSETNLQVEGGDTLRVSFDITNVGARTGMAVPQVYLTGRGGSRVLRLLGWQKIVLQPKQSQHVSLDADARLLADFDAAAVRWRIAGGQYRVGVGADAGDLPLGGSTVMRDATRKP